MRQVCRMDKRSTGSVAPYRRSILVIFLIAAVFILGYIAATVETLPPDTDAYRRIATNLQAKGIYSLDGETPTAYRPPGYVIFICLVEGVTGNARLVLYLQAVIQVFFLILCQYK